jgi:hypothetical protein
MNIENYPEVATCTILCRCFDCSKRYSESNSQLQKAFAITKSEETKQKLDQLKGKSTFTLTTKELEKYVGAFEFESIFTYCYTSIKGNALWVSAPGQGEFELVPLSTDAFTIKGMSGYKIQFEMDGNKPVGLTSTQPNGTYKAHVKK